MATTNAPAQTSVTATAALAASPTIIVKATVAAVPTAFILPNGAEQPFFHIMFENLSIAPALVVAPVS